MGKTSIGWTDRSANPIRARHKATGKVGWHCVMKSPGCARCYSQTLNGRFGTGLPYSERSGGEVEIFFDPRPMEAILRMRQKGQKHFLCDMTDLFGDFVADEQIDRVFAYMAFAFDQTFQILTKRIERVPAYFEGLDRRRRGYWHEHAGYFADLVKPSKEIWSRFVGRYGCGGDPASLGDSSVNAWPLPNVWVGCSVEDQKRADERLPILKGIPAAVRYVSYEPMLGPVDWEGATPCGYYCDESVGHVDHSLSWLDWCILGGESGPDRRPMDVEWMADSIEQLRKWGVPCYVKQDSGPKPGMQGRIPNDLWSIREFPAVPAAAAY